MQTDVVCLFVTLLVSLESETVSTVAMVGHTLPQCHEFYISGLVRLAVVGSYGSSRLWSGAV